MVSHSALQSMCVMKNTDNTGRCQALKQRTRYVFTHHHTGIRQWEEHKDILTSRSEVNG